ncbi:MAG: methyltransferase domain-containing protein [Bacteroidia bacterium]|nr:methyltransferase domain-containing protein [Bacteroidia bacterium]MCF8426742.1 methyltransferase domain-containing protein [Bacteroidia bacterium]MCF8446711.1 methyltransferase domain-containing protein [Bacteroidia bacterium]
MKFKERSAELELLDGEGIPQADLYQNLKELDTINTLLGGHAVTLKGVKTFGLRKDKTYTILEIGCGGGDNLMAIAKWARKEKLQLQLIGVDLKKDCISYANEHCKEYPEISFICSDYRDLKKNSKTYDLIFSSLFCHHFSKTDLKELMQFKKEKSDLGYFINDLHRHAIAYYSIAFLTQLFSKSYLVKNDAKLSVWRGFKRNDWQDLLVKENKNQYKIKWVWAFRWLVHFKK